MTTRIEFNDAWGKIVIHEAVGTYDGAPASRGYEIRVLGSRPVDKVLINGETNSFRQIGRRVYIDVPATPVNRKVIIDILSFGDGTNPDQ